MTDKTEDLPELTRAGTPGCVSRMLRLINQIWPEHYTPIIGGSQVKYMMENYQSEKNISDEISRGVEYYILTLREKDSGYLAVEKQGEALYLSKIYVLSVLRGRGFGRFMERFAEKRAQEQGLKKIFLHVNKNNTNSIKAYEKMGYVIKTERVKDIGGGYVMDDYVMEKSLNK